MSHGFQQVLLIALVLCSVVSCLLTTEEYYKQCDNLKNLTDSSKAYFEKENPGLKVIVIENQIKSRNRKVIATTKGHNGKKYYIKTPTLSMNAIPDEKEFFAYNILHLLGVAPKDYFVISGKCLYVGTEDANFNEFKDLNDHAQKKILKTKARLFSLILALDDITDNYGNFGLRTNTQSDLMIVDFTINDPFDDEPTYVSEEIATLEPEELDAMRESFYKIRDIFQGSIISAKRKLDDFKAKNPVFPKSTLKEYIEGIKMNFAKFGEKLSNHEKARYSKTVPRRPAPLKAKKLSNRAKPFQKSNT